MKDGSVIPGLCLGPAFFGEEIDRIDGDPQAPPFLPFVTVVSAFGIEREGIESGFQPADAASFPFKFAEGVHLSFAEYHDPLLVVPFFGESGSSSFLDEVLQQDPCKA